MIFNMTLNLAVNTHCIESGEIALSLASLSIKRAARVRSRLDPLVTERWNSITMCYFVCAIMHVKDP